MCVYNTCLDSSALHTARCTLHTAHSSFSIGIYTYCTLHTAQCTLYTGKSALIKYKHSCVFTVLTLLKHIAIQGSRDGALQKLWSGDPKFPSTMFPINICSQVHIFLVQSSQWKVPKMELYKSCEVGIELAPTVFSRTTLYFDIEACSTVPQVFAAVLSQVFVPVL